MPITLQYVNDGSFEDPVIEYFSHGWPTHVDVVCTDRFPAGYLLGARLSGGVSIRKPDYREFKRVARVTLPTTFDQDAKFWEFLKDQLGKPYDWIGVADFAVPFIPDRNWRDESRWFCSDLIERAKEVCGLYPHPLAAPANLLTPSDSLNLSSAFAEVHYVH